MYNTNFKVKYKDIEKELTKKNSYNIEDIQNICDKLYRDELCSVFYAEDIIDDKIDEGYKTIYGKMILNPEFKNVVFELKNIVIKNNTSIEDNHDLDFLILLSLFSKDMFYITHKCICQQLTLEKIDDILLSELLKIGSEFLSKLNL
uniref:Uncharacterized protein n=1 Tax=viral metagenome TaxID=1070528 RepID=A0A6C0KPA2_9ZZZZ